MSRQTASRRCFSEKPGECPALRRPNGAFSRLLELRATLRKAGPSLRSPGSAQECPKNVFARGPGAVQCTPPARQRSRARSSGKCRFNEADGHFSEVLNGSIGWFHLYGTSQNDLPSFHTRYEAAVTLCNGLPNPSNVRTKARELLQGLYTSIPFETMKRAEYDYHVRPPQ